MQQLDSSSHIITDLNIRLDRMVLNWPAAQEEEEEEKKAGLWKKVISCHNKETAVSDDREVGVFTTSTEPLKSKKERHRKQCSKGICWRSRLSNESETKWRKRKRSKSKSARTR
jgi:hypothetical protein